MTEKGGGSDVAAGTSTVAVHDRGDQYLLYGHKWFSSATDSDMSLTLARIADPEGNTISGTKGLTMFFLRTRDPNTNELNGINVIKLKEKLGTRQLPTAELLLDGTVARKMSEEGRGVAAIADMLQITRLHNTISAVAGMRRCVDLAKDYATKRVVFGKLLKDIPLHVQTLAKMELETRAGQVLMFEVTRLLGLDENNAATEDDKMLLRLLNPIVKLFTAKQAIAVASETLESIGGQGYIEDTGLPRALRDAQVLSIWEGTTNVLSMDVLRVLSKTNGAAAVNMNNAIKNRLSDALKSDGDMRTAAEKIANGMDRVLKTVAANPVLLEAGARSFAYTLARSYAAAVLMHFATSTRDQQIIATALRWAAEDLTPFLTDNDKGMFLGKYTKEDSDLLYGN